MAKRRKKQNSAGWLGLLLFLLLFAFVLFKVVFVIRYVDVTGTSSIGAEEIKRAADLDYGGSIFTCSEESIRKGVNALGEIELVSVSKKLPSTIILEVRCRTATAVAVYQNSLVVLDESGHVISVGKDIPTGCVYVTGLHIMSCRTGEQITAENGQVEAMCAAVNAIDLAGGVRYVKELDMDDIDNIEITAVNNTIVSIGNSDDLEAKMAWMTAAIGDLVTRGQTGGTLDVSSGTKADYSEPVVEVEKII